MTPEDAFPPSALERTVAGGRSHTDSPDFGSIAAPLLENGFRPIPILHGTKRPALAGWSSVPVDAETVRAWSRQFAGCGVGLRTGTVVGIDLDLEDPDLAHRVAGCVLRRFGATLVRVGRWPKRLLVYRTEAAFPKLSIPRVEILAQGQQFVAFGLHPVTQRPYHWLGATPLEVPRAELPLVDRQGCEALLAELAQLVPPAGEVARAPRKGPQEQEHLGAGPVRNADGRIIDGRDGWLSTIAFHAVQDEVAGPLDADALTDLVWERFQTSAELDRPRGGGTTPYARSDAGRKVAAKLQLHTEGRLPPRLPPPVEAGYPAPTLTVAVARQQLDAALHGACARIEAWHRNDNAGPAPQIGLRATVGLGKSVMARRHMCALRERLIALGAPSRLLVCVPSHALADELAPAWCNDGANAVVLRGYQARDAASGQPMCRDTVAVKAAVAAGLDVHSTVCARAGRRCEHFAGCHKQRNRAEVAAADVVIASYDLLFSGFGDEADAFGAILIDEGCWARAAVDRREGLESFATGGGASRRADIDAELQALSERMSAALIRSGSGPVTPASFAGTGLTTDDARLAATLEARQLRHPGLYPGMPNHQRGLALERAGRTETVHRRIEVWRALTQLLEGHDENRLRVQPAAGGLNDIVVTGVKAVHRTLQGLPILHLDATLRLDLARCVLPNLEMTSIEAAAPQMMVRLVTGSFGKGQLCPATGLAAGERRRRANRLAECVDYVRWQARRVAPKPVLIVTYLACEAAFADIPGVSVRHFNAIAGLDGFRDVGALIVVGRPLPSSHDLDQQCGAYFGHRPGGGYRQILRGVRMRDGSSRAVRAVTHEDAQAELLRAAICDNELVQAIGRGRGVNRTAETPLEVHVLADVALPVVHDQALAWELVVPDLVQRMLLAGLAVDSPGDAAVLHPGLFSGAEQAKKAFQRGGVGGQNPIRDTYREMSLKAARYRRPGPGRSWQSACWITGDAPTARADLEKALGPVAEWRPVDPNQAEQC